MKSTKAKGSKYYNYLQLGDEFGISNLNETDAKTFNVHFFTDAKDALLAFSWYGATPLASPDVDVEIETAANFGKAPINSMVIFGHAGGGSMWGGIGTFTPSSVDLSEPKPTFEQAEMGMLPRRCWFTKGASVRSVGCNSDVFATGFAKNYLKNGASIISTTSNVVPKCQGPPHILSGLLGDPTGCVYYNGVEFNSSSTAGAGTTLEGPFWTPADFHAGAFWRTISGKN